MPHDTGTDSMIVKTVFLIAVFFVVSFVSIWIYLDVGTYDEGMICRCIHSKYVRMKGEVQKQARRSEKNCHKGCVASVVSKV